MTTLYKPVRIESAEQVEALPAGAVLHRTRGSWPTGLVGMVLRSPHTDRPYYRVGVDHWPARRVVDTFAEALVPIEAEEETARAPKPKPAWHGAVAVIAHTAGDKERRAMVKCGETRIGRRPLETSWDDSAHGAVLDADDLIDPVPLVEAKVTDGMVKRARQRGSDLVGALWDAAVVKAMLTAALNIGDDK